MIQTRIHCPSDPQENPLQFVLALNTSIPVVLFSDTGRTRSHELGESGSSLQRQAVPPTLTALVPYLPSAAITGNFVGPGDVRRRGHFRAGVPPHGTTFSHVLDRFNQTSGEQWPVLRLPMLPSACTPSTAPSLSVMGCVFEKMRRLESPSTSRYMPCTPLGFVSICIEWLITAARCF